MLIVGFNPYVTNLVTYSNPFYPLFSADLAKIPDPPDVNQRPVPYRSVAAPVAFVMSLTERTAAASTETMDAPYQFKNPFSVRLSEVAAMEYPDARRGGFGPLFLLALGISLVTLVLMLVWHRELEWGLTVGAVGYGVMLSTLLTLLMIEAWWARLAPVFYLVPVLIAAGGLSAAGKEPGRAWSRDRRAGRALHQHVAHTRRAGVRLPEPAGCSRRHARRAGGPRRTHRAIPRPLGC